MVIKIFLLAIFFIIAFFIIGFSMSLLLIFIEGFLRGVALNFSVSLCYALKAGLIMCVVSLILFTLSFLLSRR